MSHAWSTPIERCPESRNVVDWELAEHNGILSATKLSDCIAKDSSRVKGDKNTKAVVRARKCGDRALRTNCLIETEVGTGTILC